MGRLFDEDCAELSLFFTFVENRPDPAGLRMGSFEKITGFDSFSPFILKLNDLRRGRGLGIGILEFGIPVEGLEVSDSGVELCCGNMLPLIVGNG